MISRLTFREKLNFNSFLVAEAHLFYKFSKKKLFEIKTNLTLIFFKRNVSCILSWLTRECVENGPATHYCACVNTVPYLPLSARKSCWCHCQDRPWNDLKKKNNLRLLEGRSCLFFLNLDYFSDKITELRWASQNQAGRNHTMHQRVRLDLVRISERKWVIHRGCY